MAVRVSVAKGVDLDYAWNAAGGREQRALATICRLLRQVSRSVRGGALVPGGWV
jgi:hypothetical protein